MEQNSEIDSHIYGQLIFYKGAKAIQWGKDSLFNKRCWKSWLRIKKEKYLDLYLTVHANINLK